MSITTVEQMHQIPQGGTVLVTNNGVRRQWTRVNGNSIPATWRWNDVSVQTDAFLTDMAANRVSNYTDATPAPGMLYVMQGANYRFCMVSAVDDGRVHISQFDKASEPEAPRFVGTSTVTAADLSRERGRWAEVDTVPQWASAMQSFIRATHADIHRLLIQRIAQNVALRDEVESLRLSLTELRNSTPVASVHAPTTEALSLNGLPLEAVQDRLHGFAGNFESTHQDDQFEEFLSEIGMPRSREFELTFTVSGTHAISISTENARSQVGWAHDVDIDEVETEIVWSKTVELTREGTSCPCESIERSDFEGHLPDGVSVDAVDWSLESCGC